MVRSSTETAEILNDQRGDVVVALSVHDELFRVFGVQSVGCTILRVEGLEFGVNIQKVQGLRFREIRLEDPEGLGSELQRISGVRCRSEGAGFKIQRVEGLRI